ncbi:MAG: aspartate carbamoyltransferase catalytic subunit [Pseudomonadota bacterium]
MSTDPWEGLLDADEQILWQGRPHDGFALHPNALVMIPFSLFFGGFSVVWMLGAAQGGGYFWTFGLLFFCVGAGMLIWAIAGDTIRRRGSYYSLSNKRAFVATNLPFQGKRLKSYRIDDETNLEFRDGDYPSVIFAKEVHRGKKSTYEVDIGFERIAEGRKVFALMRGLQNGEAET